MVTPFAGLHLIELRDNRAPKLEGSIERDTDSGKYRVKYRPGENRLRLQRRTQHLPSPTLKCPAHAHGVGSGDETDLELMLHAAIN